MLAVAGGKGGCGKTTTTLGIATTLARRGRRVLAVDADRDMPDLHALAGVPNDPTIAALEDDGRGGRLASDGGSAAVHRPERSVGAVARQVPDHPRVAVLPAAPGVERSTLRRGLRRVRAGPGVAVVDCPAGAGPDAVDPIRIADRVVVVTTPSPASLRDATKTAALARELETPVVGGVVTRTERVPDGVGRLLGAPVVATPESDDPLGDPAVRRATAEAVDLAF